jgi:hypothetical protein
MSSWVKRVAVGALMLAASTQAIVDQQASEHTGTLRVLAVSHFNQPTQYQYYLEDPATQQRFKMHTHPVQFKSGEIKSGSPVTVKGTFVNGELHSEAVHHRETGTHGNHKHGMHGLALQNPPNGIRLALIVPDFSLCPRGTGFTAAPVGNVTQYKNAYFEGSNPNGYTAGMQLRACSHRNYTIDETNSTVIRFTVPLANCSTGTSYFANMSACPTMWGGLTTDFKNLAAQAGYTNWSSYTNHWMFLPKDWGCSFGGLGWVGADGLWIPDQYYTSIQIVLHEFGHNFGMNHAALYTNGVASEYGDASAMMGAQRDVCYSTANRETAGWQTVPTINMSSQPYGLWTNFSIAAQDKFEHKGLKIVTFLQRDGATSGTSNVSYYLEFRRVSRWWDLKLNTTVPKGGDLNFNAAATGVVLHFYPNPIAGANALGGAWWTTYEGVLKLVNGTFISDANRTGLHFLVRSNNTYDNSSDYAEISICRCAVGLAMNSCCTYPTPAPTYAPTKAPTPTPSNDQGDNNNNQGKQKMTIGIVGGACAAVAFGAATAVFIVKKKRGTLPRLAFGASKQTTTTHI